LRRPPSSSLTRRSTHKSQKEQDGSEVRSVELERLLITDNLTDKAKIIGIPVWRFGGA
jgi:hypothetical protein